MKHGNLTHLLKQATLCIALFIIAIAKGGAQTISVTDFYLDEKDLVANSRDGMVADQNGDKCALIRVQTTQKGFTFDVGSAGITKTDYSHPGEVWLYVPWGVKHIKIAHPQLGTLPNYDFPISIQRARTYIMKITSDKVFTNTYDDNYKQRLLIRVEKANPYKTIVTLNGMNVPLNAKGEAERVLALGTYTYKIDAEGFYPKEDQITIDDTLKATTLVVNDLRPIMGKLSVMTDPVSAQILVDGKPIDGLTSGRTVDMQVGHYKVTIQADGYRSETVEATVDKGQTARLSVPLTQVAKFHITSSPSGANVKIGDETQHITPFDYELRTDLYEVWATKKGYKDFHKTLSLKCSDPRLHVRLNKIFNYKNEVYIEPGVMLGQFVGIGGAVGAYFSNVNVEGFYYHPMQNETEPIYWVNTHEGENHYPREATYIAKMAAGLRVGYGFALGTRLRLTPQLGAQFVKTGVNKDDTYSYCANGAYATSLVASARLSVAIVNHFGLSITPSYAFAVMQSDGFKDLANLSSDFKKFGTGFNLRIGLNVFF